MKQDKTGGAAFPLESDYGSQPGMTLRDYFAGQVIGGLLECSSLRSRSDHSLAAEVAYRVADAMIAERAKAAGVSKAAFDRAGYNYHGRVKALADAAREGGLEF